jgi:hypothetical protein
MQFLLARTTDCSYIITTYTSEEEVTYAYYSYIRGRSDISFIKVGDNKEVKRLLG